MLRAGVLREAGMSGLRHGRRSVPDPLQLLPICIFEFAWKTTWLFAIGLPQWLAGRVDRQLSKDLFDIGFIGPVLFGLVIP